MLNDFLYAIWFFLPAGAANLAPLLVTKLPLLRTWTAPLDGHQTFQGSRLLGGSKTWRGLVCGVILAGITFWVQQNLASHLGSFSDYLATVRYADLSLWLGLLLGFGALAGDAVESFFKRRLAVAPGKSWFPFDQLDYIIGACVCSLLVIRLPLHLYIWIFAVWFSLHLVFSYLGYLFHFKKHPI